MFPILEQIHSLKRVIHTKKIRSKSAGFTLLEVIIAALILSIGIMALAQAFNLGLLASTDVEGIDLALNIAQARIEQIKNTAFASIVSSPSTPDSNFSNYNVTVTVTGVNPKQVVVTVSWNVKGGSTNVALTTLVANY